MQQTCTQPSLPPFLSLHTPSLSLSLFPSPVMTALCRYLNDPLTTPSPSPSSPLREQSHTYPPPIRSSTQQTLRHPHSHTCRSTCLCNTHSGALLPLVAGMQTALSGTGRSSPHTHFNALSLLLTRSHASNAHHAPLYSHMNIDANLSRINL